MLVSLGFIFLIVVMSAFLAVLADNVGRKLGKKRMSFKCRVFSVRPKHVAQIGTALTGAGVSLATILLVTILSKDVRDWIIRGQNAIVEAEATIKKNAQLAAQTTSLESTLKTRDGQIKAKDQEIQSKSQEVAKGRTELDKQRVALASLQGDVRRLRDQIPQLRNDVAKARQKVAETNGRLHQGETRLASVRKNLASVNRLLDQNTEILNETTRQKNDITRQNTDLLAKTGELEGKQKELQSDITRLEKARGDLETARDAALSELERTQQDLAVQQRALRNVQADLLKSEEDLRQATLYGVFFRDIARLPRIAPPTFQAQEEVTRLSVEAGMSQASAEAAMEKLLRAARLAAIEKGAKPNEEYPEAGIFERRDPDTGEKVSGEELRRLIVSKMAGSRQPLVLVASSTLNAFKGEPVSLDIVVYPNPLVYKHGQLVAESRVDGRRDDVEIFRQVTEFLGPKVRERARQDRMIPRSGNGEMYGSIPSETIVKLVSDVKAAERPVRVVALAASDTRAGDSLKLAFQVR